MAYQSTALPHRMERLWVGRRMVSREVSLEKRLWTEIRRLEELVDLEMCWMLSRRGRTVDSKRDRAM